MRDELDLRLKKAELDSNIVEASLRNNFNRPTDTTILKKMLGQSAQSWVIKQLIPNDDGISAWGEFELTARINAAKTGKDNQKLLKERLQIMEWATQSSPKIDESPIFSQLTEESLPFNQESTQASVQKAINDSPYVRLKKTVAPVSAPVFLNTEAPLIETVPATGSLPTSHVYEQPRYIPETQHVPKTRQVAPSRERELVSSVNSAPRHASYEQTPVHRQEHDATDAEFTNDSEKAKEPSRMGKFGSTLKEYLFGDPPPIN